MTSHELFVHLCKLSSKTMFERNVILYGANHKLSFFNQATRIHIAHKFLLPHFFEI